MVLTLVCLGGAGMAQDRDAGLYASFSGLLVVPQDSEFSVPIANVTRKTDISMTSGIGFLAAVGYSLPSGLRAEFELGYRGFDFDKVKNGTGSNDGEFSTLSLMANGIYSFDVRGFRPYAGIGVGLANHQPEFKTINFQEGDVAVGVTLVQEGSASAFAYQGLAGVGFQLSDRAEVLLGYRYFGSAAVDLANGIEMTYGTHNFEVGLRYGF